MSLEQLKQNLEQFEQQHLLQFWNDLSVDEKEALAVELKEIEFKSLYRTLHDSKSSKLQSNKNLKPLPACLKGSVEKSSKEEVKIYEAKGLKAIADGQVAVLLLAGGQGKMKFRFDYF